MESTKNVLQCIANESEEMRDKIVDMFREKAKIERLFYLHIVADETYDKYFESNFGVITLPEALILYNERKREKNAKDM